MDIRLIEDAGGKIMVVSSDEPVLKDAQTSLDTIVWLYYEYGAQKVLINKSGVAEDFFKLSSGLAGEIAQKFVTYHFKLAIVGDFSHYTSEPLKAYMYESNRGRHLYFAATEEEALQWLKR